MNLKRIIKRVIKGEALSISFLCVMAVCLSSCGSKAPEEKAQVARPVKTMVVADQQVVSKGTYPGKAEAINTADIAFEVSGKLIELPIKRGQEVAKDFLIARLDPRDYKYTVAAANASYVEAQSDLKRYRKLYEDGVVPIADLKVKEEKHDVSLSDLNRAEKALDDTNLRAPFKGVIAKQFVENFQNINAKEPIVRLQDLTQIKVVIDIPESDASSLTKKKGEMSAVAEFDALPGRRFDLKLLEWETEADPMTQTFHVKFVMDSPDDVMINPGMTAGVALFDDRKESKDTSDRIIVPVDAVFPDAEGNSQVWVLDVKDDTVHKRKVSTGEITGTNGIVITGGIKQGEVIVVSGIRHLREGMKVLPKSENEKLVD
ncbi:MAG: efflux RND transporter periplasmic adaptor subunit [Candidatus Ancaeobacter aquaticus]|nr:efflux RND transporter periplasmic adaptor subunit [Candidatus Ancaeobacter aquaticus]